MRRGRGTGERDEGLVNRFETNFLVYNTLTARAFPSPLLSPGPT